MNLRDLGTSIAVSCRARSTPIAVLLALLIALSAVWLLSPVPRGLDSAVVGETAGIYFEIAVNRSYCGRYPYITGAVPDTTLNLRNIRVGDFGDVPVRRIIEDAVGSITGYCAVVGAYLPMHEASMVLVDSSLLTVIPNLTLKQLGRATAWLGTIALVLFAFFLLKLRYSIVFVFGTIMSGLYLTVLLGGDALYSQYPLVLPSTLAGISAGGLCLIYRLHQRTGWFLCCAFVLGFWSGFLGNLRTSHYPIGVLVGVLFIAFGTRDTLDGTPRRKAVLLAMSAFLIMAAGLLTFDVSFILPHRAVSQPGIYSYHVIAHPLVLGLATPPNELAKREGIEWDDRVGVAAARKVQPDVTYLGPGYESALFRYYLRLWSSYPAEMLGIYFRKLLATHISIQEFLLSTRAGLFWPQKDGRWLGLAAFPATLVGTTITVPGLFGALFLAGCIRLKILYIDLPRGFCLAALFGAGVFAFVESAVVLSGVVLWYSSILVFSFVIAGLFLYQMVLDAIVIRIWRGASED